MRKVHCGCRDEHRIGCPVSTSYCGQRANIGRRVQILAPEQFAWLPRSSQCENCRDLGAAIHRTSATPEMLVTVECFVGELARFCRAADELGTHEERGCYFHDISEPCRYCDDVSWLNPHRWEMMIAVALGLADDGYIYRHVCEECGIAFRTKEPRGACVVCAFCRGKIEDALSNREWYTSAFMAEASS